MVLAVASQGLYAAEDAAPSSEAPLSAQEMTAAVKAYVGASADERQQLLANWSGRAEIKPKEVSRWARAILAEARKSGPKFKSSASMPKVEGAAAASGGQGGDLRGAPVAVVETPAGPMRVAVLKDAGGRGKGTVIYLHGGGGSNGARDNEMTWGWGVSRTAMLSCASTRLLTRCLAKDDAATNAWILPHEVQSVSTVLDAYLRSTDADPDRIYLVGHSMGGYGAWVFASIEPDRYGAIVNVAGEAHRATYENFCNVDFASFLGLKDHRAAKAKEGMDALAALSAKQPGYYRSHWAPYPDKEHDIGAAQYKDIDGYLRPLKRTAYPRLVVWHPVAEWKTRFYNIGMARPSPGKTSVRAEMGQDNMVTVTSSGADALTVYLNERLIDFEKDVAVVWNGKRVHAGRLSPCLDVMLETLADRCDSGMFYTAKVSLRAGMPEAPAAAAP
ncbi:MAG: alpha/beta hydrolase [Phycisphaerae bacterium]|nr:alpha/beta hydrolase [Phycisphaerae bacterium]